MLTANLTMTTRLRNKSLKNMGQMECVGPSLGSFSVSKQLLELFLSGFKAELNAKVYNLDSSHAPLDEHELASIITVSPLTPILTTRLLSSLTPTSTLTLGWQV